MAFLKFSRDKRGYENFYLVQPTTRRGSKSRPRILYWFRTPPHVKVGRKPFDVEVQRSLETRNPGVAFDWETIVNTPIPPVDAEHWRERRRIDREIRRSQSEPVVPVVDEPPKPGSVGDDINGVADIADVADGAVVLSELAVTAAVSEATPATPQAAGTPPASLVLDPLGAVRGAGRRRRRRRGRRGRSGLPGGGSQGAPAASTNGIQEVEHDERPEAGPEEPEGNGPTGEV